INTLQSGVLRVIPNHANPPMWQSTLVGQPTEGEKDTIVVKFADADGDAISLYASNIPAFAHFVDKGNGIGWLTMQPDYTQSGRYSFDVTAKDSYGLQSIHSISFAVTDASPIERIILNQSMIHDLVQGGSVSPASLLVDEQSLDPDKKESPVSASWKPYYTNVRAPYHIYFDLGKAYVIRRLKVHDMNNVGVLSFSTGTPDAWLDWFNYNTAAYNTWINFDIKDTTQFVRLSQWNATSAEINELALYGYELNHAPQLQYISLPQLTLNSNDTIHIRYTDAENDAIQLSASNLPPFADFQQMGNGQAIIYLYASQKVEGSSAIVLKASDSKEYVSTDTIRIVVTKNGSDAVITPRADTEVRIGYNRNSRTLMLYAAEQHLVTQITAISGRVVLTSGEHVIPLTALSRGAYMVVVRDALSGRIVQRKMVVV
ncbi:MAG: hypothetical protein WCJ03_12065, partial [Bacteroidales bacterium]